MMHNEENNDKQKISYPIRTGCQLKIKKDFFAIKPGRNPIKKNSKTSPYLYLGHQILKVEVLKHSYGQKKGQHTFTCKVLQSVGGDYVGLNINDNFLIKGRNLYSNVIEHLQGEESKAETKLNLSHATFLK